MHAYTYVMYITLYYVYNSLLYNYPKEKDFVLSEQQKELLEKEQQKSATSKKLNEVKEQQQILKNDLIQICQSLQEVSIKSAMLTSKKECL